MNDVRLLRLLSLLQTGRAWTGPELAADLAVSLRTVRRDVERLRELGYPVEANLGTHGGYRLVAGTAMPPLLLDDDEAVAIAAALRPEDEASQRALAKLAQVLPARLSRRVRAVRDATEALVGIRRGGAPEAVHVDPEVMAELAIAVRGGERVRFGYTGRDAGPGERHAEPHRLVGTGSRWYLVAYDLDRDGWRSFRLDRVGGVFRTGARVDGREPPVDAAAFVAESIHGARARHKAVVVLHVNVKDAGALLAEDTGVLAPLGEERTLLTTGGDALDWLAVRLALLGVPFEVREPPELAAFLEELGTRLLAASRSCRPA
ncbi:DNA-binding transcriptional regulator [Actinorhabdospora filicis]|uniref:DNA-binding transcriptional regulator n=1 Tax=Actinorhabdospora filicis TaxID=1785913 RepID=A0A9W6SQH5_9ACTN|nr:WYL domain-containing protein [Actinorhabdospora filicis]GLZ80012.1 DNA-binding transcriptional regulator [Actinorhabdospora filicis]